MSNTPPASESDRAAMGVADGRPSLVVPTRRRGRPPKPTPARDELLVSELLNVERRDVPRLASALRRLFFSDAEPALSVSECARRIGRSYAHTARLVRAGVIESRTERGHRVVPLSAVEQYLRAPGELPPALRPSPAAFSFFAKSREAKR